MSWKTRPSRFPLIQPDVITLGLKHPIQGPNHFLDRLHWLVEFGALQFGDSSLMHSRRDQKMPIIIGITIQYDERMSPAKHNQIVPVVFLCQPPTEKATDARLGRSGRR